MYTWQTTSGNRGDGQQVETEVMADKPSLCPSLSQVTYVYIFLKRKKGY